MICDLEGRRKHTVIFTIVLTKEIIQIVRRLENSKSEENKEIERICVRKVRGQKETGKADRETKWRENIWEIFPTIP